jgi:23S rRNA (guanosine2251-2'-O)-methyltransferase
MDQELEGTIIYGIHPVADLIQSNIRQIDRIYFANERATGALFDLVKLARKERLPYQMVPLQKLDYLARTQNHQGAVAFCSAVEFASADDLLTIIDKKERPPLLLVPASVEDPGNLGALIRSCVAFGVDAVLLERKNTAPIGGTVAKASAGTLDHIPLVKPKNLEGLMDTLVARGFGIVGAEQGGTKKPADADLTQPTVLILGGENRGIPPYLAKKCTDIVGIPISSAAQSLNVSAAAAILLYECARQRKFDF